MMIWHRQGILRRSINISPSRPGLFLSAGPEFLERGEFSQQFVPEMDSKTIVSAYFSPDYHTAPGLSHPYKTYTCISTPIMYTCMSTPKHIHVYRLQTYHGWSKSKHTTDFKSLPLQKSPTSFHGSPRTYQTRFLGSPQNFKLGFT